MARRASLAALASAALLAILTLGPAAARAADLELTVMTRNLSFGTDLGPIVAATTEFEFVTAVAAAYAQAQASDFPGRAKAWADEIERARPDLIGLQEAVLWRTQTPADFSPTPNATTSPGRPGRLLLAELRSRGLKYEVVIAQAGYDIEAPGLFPTGLVDVRLTQREVILARKAPGLKLTNAQGGQYAAYVTVPTIIGVPVALPWAWASVDVTKSGRSFRFATTHLDPISGAAQQLQANEFLAGPGSTTLPIVWVGDFNSDAEATVDLGGAVRDGNLRVDHRLGILGRLGGAKPVRVRLHLLPGDEPPEPDLDAGRTGGPRPDTRSVPNRKGLPRRRRGDGSAALRAVALGSCRGRGDGGARER